MCGERNLLLQESLYEKQGWLERDEGERSSTKWSDLSAQLQRSSQRELCGWMGTEVAPDIS